MLAGKSASQWRSLSLISLAVATMAFGLPLVSATVEAKAASAVCSSTPFTSSSKYRYRLPAVVQTDGGRLFVFAEKRINNYDNDDDGDFDIVMRTSTDGGCTWGSARTVASDGTHRVSNPVPIYDPKTDRVLLFTTVKVSSGNKLHLQYLSSDGKTVTSLSKGLVTVANWRPGLTGPGHGLVLTTGAHAGRIIFAMGYTDNATKKRATRGIYSDDGGTTWQVGYDRVSPSKLQLIEGTIAELPNGNLLVSYRDNGKGVTKPGANRVSGISTDGGASVGGYAAMSGIKTVPVQGSLLQATGTSDLLLFSSPSWTSGKITSRRGMRIFASTNSATSWKSGLAIGEATDSACYSDLVQLDDATIGIAFESGYTSYWKKIVFRQVKLSTIAKTLLPALSKTKSPTASGTAKVGKTLAASTGAWSPSAESVSYRWLRNGKLISKATAAKYKLTTSDRGKKISVRVTVSATGYRDTTATSSARKIH